MNMVMSVISQDTALTIEEASELVANSKRAAPGQRDHLAPPVPLAPPLVLSCGSHRWRLESSAR